MVSLLQEISSPTYLYLDANIRSWIKIDANPPAPFEVEPPAAEVPVQSSRVPNSEQASPKDTPNVTTSEPTHSKPDTSLVETLKEGVEQLHSVMHDGEGILSHKPSHFDTGVRTRTFQQSFLLVEEADTVDRNSMSTRKMSLGLLLGIDPLLMSPLKAMLSSTTPGYTTRVSYPHRSPKSPNSASHQAAAKVVFTGPLVDDVSALGDENLLAHNPESFAL
jgi:hypothetical protein